MAMPVLQMPSLGDMCRRSPLAALRRLPAPHRALHACRQKGRISKAMCFVKLHGPISKLSAFGLIGNADSL